MTNYAIKYYDTDLFCDGIILYWIKEIHINKKWYNTPMASEIIKHELTHAWFIEKIEEIKDLKGLHNKFIKIGLIVLNNFMDFLDSYRLMFKKFFYNRHKNKEQIALPSKVNP